MRDWKRENNKRKEEVKEVKTEKEVIKEKVAKGTKQENMAYFFMSIFNTFSMLFVFYYVHIININ